MSDETLMLAFARDGDAGSFDQLYQRHRGPLFRFLLRQCVNRALTEEMFQDVWLALVGARQRYAVEAKFTTYLYTLARHRVIDHFRRQGVRAAVDTELDDDTSDMVATSAPGPEVQVDASRQVKEVLALVEALPAAQREVLLLRAEAGLSIEEIAEITQAERETVKSRLRYAMDKLRRGMEGRI